MRNEMHSYIMGGETNSNTVDEVLKKLNVEGKKCDNYQVERMKEKKNSKRSFKFEFRFDFEFKFSNLRLEKKLIIDISMHHASLHE